MILAGKRAVVTGATRGIGASIARALGAAGVATLHVGRDERRLTESARLCERAAVFVADLTKADAAVQLAIAAPSLLGGTVDFLINNAGIFAIAPVEDVSEEILSDMLAVNLAAPFRLLREFIPPMRAQGRGHVITIGSIADRHTLPRNGVYAATKYGARAMHEVVHGELKGSGVRATLISPGPTDTPLWDSIDPDRDAAFTPRAEMLRADEVADAVLWVLSRPERMNVDELRLSHS